MKRLWRFLTPQYISEFYVDRRGRYCIRTWRTWLGRTKVVYDDTYAGGY